MSGERWVNAVVTIRVPLEISPDADLKARGAAAVDAFERFDLHDDCAATINTEVVVDGEPESPWPVSTFKLEPLIGWHDRRAKVKRINADLESDPITRATLLGNADSHDLAGAVLRCVLEDKPVEGL